ncbi:hypothetical protein CK203_023931 [Vitis vinifera]|uniref:Uncharacterized protein n=1 Tax=Vitis vinifera TaxID=29760 RepID=A0A438JA05_VITVI|nr:hypothetical protein CK203_023931 [Vitis vinifera]
MAKAKEGGLIRGFKIEGRGEEGTQVSLIVASNTFLFCEDKEDQGLEDVDRVAALFGCKAGKLPTSYLGLSLGAPHKSYGV